MKTTAAIANELVTLCRAGNFEKVYTDLFDHELIQSIEPEGATFKTVTGMEAILQKGQQWQEMVEAVISSEISDPIVAENFFTISMKMTVKLKGMPEAIDMDELCVYQVANEKVVMEQFFYTPEAHSVEA